MGGCFPCFGSSNKDGNGVKEVAKKEFVKDPLAAQSVNRVNSGNICIYWVLCSSMF